MPQESAKPQSIKPLEEQGTKSNATKPKAKKTRKSATSKKSKGLGDTIAKVTEATGIDKVVKAVAGEDCGCKERQEKLNDLFPYAKPMTDESKAIWENELAPAFANGRLSAKHQHAMIHVYEQVFSTRRDFHSCGGCVQRALVKLQKAYEACD